MTIEERAKELSQSIIDTLQYNGWPEAEKLILVALRAVRAEAVEEAVEEAAKEVLSKQNSSSLTEIGGAFDRLRAALSASPAAESLVTCSRCGGLHPVESMTPPRESPENMPVCPPCVQVMRLEAERDEWKKSATHLQRENEMFAEGMRAADVPSWNGTKYSNPMEWVGRLATQRDAALAANLAMREVVEAAKSFATLVNSTSGRIPVERLSLADWHQLTRAFNAVFPSSAVTKPLTKELEKMLAMSNEAAKNRTTPVEGTKGGGEDAK